MRVRWSWIALVLLAGGAALALVEFPPEGVRPAERRFHSHERALAGESLLHGLENRDANWYMPLLTVPLALYEHGPHWLWPAWRIWYWGAAFLLTGVLGGACGGPVGAAVALVASTAQPWRADEYSAFAFLVAGAAGLLAWRARRPSPGRDWAAAAGIALTLLSRSTLCFLPPLLAVLAWRAAPPGRRTRAALPWLAAPALLLLPWLWMNLRLEGRVIPFERDRGDDVIIAGALGYVSPPQGDLPALAGLGLDDSAALWAVGRVLRDPLPYLRGVAARAAYIAAHGPWLLLLAALGCWFGRRLPEVRALGGLAAYLVLVHCMVSVDAPYLRPLWTVCAVLAGAAASSLFPSPLRVRFADAAGPAAGAALAPVAALAVFSLSVVAAFPARRGPDAAVRALAASPHCPWLNAYRGRELLLAARPREALPHLHVAAVHEPSNEALIELAWARVAAGGTARFLDNVALRPDQGRREDLRGLLLQAVDRARRGDREGAQAAALTAKAWYVRPHEPGRPRDLAFDETLAATLRAFPEGQRPSLDRQLRALAGVVE